jgi:hypothetical protein
VAIGGPGDLDDEMTGRLTPRSLAWGSLTRLPTTIPDTVSFRVVRDRGLLVRAWINGSGPYALAIDTGAGGTIISERLAAQTGIPIQTGRAVSLAGLSGRTGSLGHEGWVKSLALGQAENLLPANRRVVVSGGLPPDIDGLLDPTEAYSPFGYVIDIPNHEISAFDCTVRALSMRVPPADGTIVRWLTESVGRRPFVRMDNGQLALIDTGSAFGLAMAQGSGDYGHVGKRQQDIGGGTLSSRRVAPTTVSIGSLTLRSVPTDIISGVEEGAPILLGRDALAPFKMVFDPLHRLIAIAPAER